MRKTYRIEVDCASCASKMEEAARCTPGVRDASVNFMMLKMAVDFEEGADIARVMREVRSACKKADRDCEIAL